MMNKENNNTQMSKRSSVGGVLANIKKIPIYLIKLAYILPFFLIGLWLLEMVYFPELEMNKTVAFAKLAEEEDIFKAIMTQKEPVPRGHFHMIDNYISVREPNPPLCVVCHGTYPHGKEKKVRSLLNFHTGFIACAVCHARQDMTDKALLERDYILRFLWVDRETSEIKEKVQGEYGKYDSKIFPIKFTEDGPERVFRPVSAKEAQQFLKYKDKFTPDQTAQAKMKLHERISDKPVFCSDCHKKDSYIDYAELGFPDKRIDHLTSTEVVGMINKYKTFYLPSVIDFGSEKAFQ